VSPPRSPNSPERSDTRLATASRRPPISECIRARLGIEVAYLERTGSPLNEIVRATDELRVDAVVVGASMQAGDRFVGAIATRLVRIARWPVTVVP
jgi:nucleotide-binding universal stress UspA family protein